MPNYFVLIKPWSVSVKEAEFFIAQGGLTQPWGKHWRPVEADSLEQAREQGKALRATKETTAYSEPDPTPPQAR